MFGFVNPTAEQEGLLPRLGREFTPIRISQIGEPSCHADQAESHLKEVVEQKLKEAEHAFHAPQGIVVAVAQLCDMEGYAWSKPISPAQARHILTELPETGELITCVGVMNYGKRPPASLTGIDRTPISFKKPPPEERDNLLHNQQFSLVYASLVAPLYRAGYVTATGAEDAVLGLPCAFTNNLIEQALSAA